MRFFSIYLFLYILCINSSDGQTPGEWIWLRGDPFINSQGSLGVQGVASSTNDPRAVYEACEWTDTSGCFWLLGGRNSQWDFFSDLYKYDPSTNEWTWMKGPGLPGDSGFYGAIGVASPANLPPAKGMAVATWTDKQNNLWMFGGAGPYGWYNDLWKYNISTNEWTWMKGSNTPYGTALYGTQGVPTNFTRPGSRSECTANWVDNNGDLWLFGGLIISPYRHFNDLWKYTISTNQWTWMKGASSPNSYGFFGFKGIEDPANNPGGREAFTNWIDGNGDFYLFGGYRNDTNYLFYQDMWKYSPLTNNWTWIAGDSTGNQQSTYVTACIGDSTNNPSGRLESRAEWKDANGNFWTYGGYFNMMLGDLWMYCISSQQWVFIRGGGVNWGIKGVSSPTNWPGGRMSSNAWTDKNGNQYLYGGGDPTNTYNDLWVYKIDTACLTCATIPYAYFTSQTELCPGGCVDFINLSSGATSYQWIFSGAVPDTSTDINPVNICYAAEGSYDVQLIVNNGNYSDTLILQNYILVNSAPSPQAINQSGDTLFAIQGSVSYQWYLDGVAIPAATDYFYVATANGDYNIIATDSNGCEVEAAIYNVLTFIQPPAEPNQLSVYPTPSDHVLHIKTKEAIDEIVIFNVFGEIILDIKENKQKEFYLDVSNFSPGMYLLEATVSGKKLRTKFVKR